MKKKKEHKQPIAISKNLTLAVLPVIERKYYLMLAFILIISFIVFLPVMSNHFINFDDDKYILNNTLIKALNLKAIFSKYVVGNYHPLTILVLAIEYHFFGLSESAFHTFNLVLHLLNVILVFYVIFLLSENPIVAIVASLLFGIHPMHVESVAWASEIKDLLYTFFFLASYLCYLKYLNSRANKFYALALVLFLLSLLSKAMAASLPIVLILTDYLKGRDLNAKSILEKVPFFIMSVVLGIIAVKAQSNALADIALFTFPQHIVFAGYSFISYIGKMILPLQLCAFYPYPTGTSAVIPTIYYLFLILSIILVVFSFYSIRFTKKIFFGIGFFLITVALVLQILPVGGAMMADRYVYIPSIGLFYLTGEAFSWLWNQMSKGFNFKIPAVILLSIMSIFYSVKTYERCGVWNNSMSFWNDIITQYQTVSAAYNNRGLLLQGTDRYDEMLNDFSKAIELKPDYFDAYNNRGSVFILQKRWSEATKDLDKAIELRPNIPLYYSNRGIARYNMNNKEGGCLDFRKALELGYKPAESMVNTYCK